MPWTLPGKKKWERVNGQRANLADPEKVAEQKKSYYRTHKEARKKAAEKYRSANREEIIRRARERYAMQRDRDPVEHKRFIKNQALKNTYGIDLAEYEAALQGTGGICEICRENLERPAIDHCHYSGTLRGIICEKCNWMLGNARDNQETLKRAIEYLQKYKEKPGRPVGKRAKRKTENGNSNHRPRAAADEPNREDATGT